MRTRGTTFIYSLVIRRRTKSYRSHFEEMHILTEIEEMGFDSFYENAHTYIWLRARYNGYFHRQRHQLVQTKRGRLSHANLQWWFNCKEWVKLDFRRKSNFENVPLRSKSTWSKLSFPHHWVHDLLEGGALVDRVVLHHRLQMWNIKYKNYKHIYEKRKGKYLCEIIDYYTQ